VRAGDSFAVIGSFLPFESSAAVRPEGES